MVVGKEGSITLSESLLIIKAATKNERITYRVNRIFLFHSCVIHRQWYWRDYSIIAIVIVRTILSFSKYTHEYLDTRLVSFVKRQHFRRRYQILLSLTEAKVKVIKIKNKKQKQRIERKRIRECRGTWNFH